MISNFSIEVSVRLLELKSTPASRESVSLPLPPFIFILAVSPSPDVVMLIVSAAPFASISKPLESEVIPSIMILSEADPVCILARHYLLNPSSNLQNL